MDQIHLDPQDKLPPHPPPFGHIVNKTPSTHRTRKCLRPPRIISGTALTRDDCQWYWLGFSLSLPHSTQTRCPNTSSFLIYMLSRLLSRKLFDREHHYRRKVISSPIRLQQPPSQRWLSAWSLVWIWNSMSSTLWAKMAIQSGTALKVSLIHGGKIRACSVN